MTQGIDVSMFQGDIDFNKVKAAGYTFVIIRINNWNNVKRCNEIEKFNGFAGVYCSRYWYTTMVSQTIRERYACWIADWASQCKYTGSYGIWQNGSATVNGVKGEVDHDYAYVDYPGIIKKSGRNDWTDKQAQTDWKHMYDVLFGQNTEALAKIKSLEAENKKMKQAIEYADSALKGVLG